MSSPPIVVTTPEQIKALIREALLELLAEIDAPKEPRAPLTDAEKAIGRKNAARLFGGRRR